MPGAPTSWTTPRAAASPSHRCCRECSPSTPAMHGCWSRTEAGYAPRCGCAIKVARGRRASGGRLRRATGNGSTSNGSGSHDESRRPECGREGTSARLHDREPAKRLFRVAPGPAPFSRYGPSRWRIQLWTCASDRFEPPSTACCYAATSGSRTSPCTCAASPRRRHAGTMTSRSTKSRCRSTLWSSRISPRSTCTSASRSRSRPPHASRSRMLRAA